MTLKRYWRWTLACLCIVLAGAIAHASVCDRGALAGERYRILISSDIGGSDPDDFQSMIHFMIYSDLFDIEGIVSSPWDTGRKEHILQVIDVYEKDYPQLKAHSERFPVPDFLRSIAKQGAIERAPSKGYRTSTEGSDWIVRCANRDNPRPLYVLVWGLPEDVAQALHDAPGIESKIRVIFIGGPNKKWGVNAYNYIEQNFPDLWMIENNSTYRGFFNGGVTADDLGNTAFFKNHIQGHGHLGDYFGLFRGGNIKMGDTPALAYMMCGEPENPETASWGGGFQKVRYRPKFIFDRQTASDDKVEVFSVVEWNLQGPDIGPASDELAFRVKTNGQNYDGFYDGGGLYRFRLSPKSTGTLSYTIESSHNWLNGQTGGFTSVDEGTLGHRPYEIEHSNWWTDRFDADAKEGAHSGAKTVNRWREDILRDWQKRMNWLSRSKRP